MEIYIFMICNVHVTAYINNICIEIRNTIKNHISTFFLQIYNNIFKTLISHNNGNVIRSRF